MSFIKFPTQIKPSRVTMRLERTDEMFVSPVTGIQQVASRGNAFWRTTYEFRDLSLSERETVQAFLMKCRGSLNTFNVTDPANYTIRGSQSDWTDLFSGRGQFVADVGSTTARLNSWWVLGDTLQNHHIDDDQTVRMRWTRRVSNANPNWWGEQVSGKVSSGFEVGKAYVQRLKFFQNPKKLAATVSMRVQSGGNGYNMGSFPTIVYTSDMVTMPFKMYADTSSISLTPIFWITGVTNIGDSFSFADYRLSRCVLVANSENLLLYSHKFDEADYSKARANIANSFGTTPHGLATGGSKIFVDTSVNTTHYALQNITKNNTEGVYTASLYAKADEYDVIRVDMFNGAGTDLSRGFFQLSSADHKTSQAGNFRNPVTQMFDVGSGWYRCVHTAHVDSHSTLQWRVTIVASYETETIQFTGNGSDGVEIYGAQLVEFPFAKPYCVSSNAAVPSSGQTGSALIVDGFDPGDIIPAGQRLEVVTQFHRDADNLYERSEFKRITETIKAHDEGWAVLEIDPPLRNSPTPQQNYEGTAAAVPELVHNPVIFTDPEMKARLVGGTVQYIEKPLQLTDIVFDVIEDLAE